MATIVDADTHVIETGAVWSEMAEHGFGAQQPEILTREDGGGAYWLFDQRVLRSQGLGPDNSKTPRGARELTDIGSRIDDMDRLGVDLHIIYSTWFLSLPTHNAALLRAMCASYNSWVASACEKSEGRLRFAAVLPLLDIHDALEELERAHSLGAVAVHLRGYEDDHLLVDPYFFPLYERAAALGVAMCIHAGNGNSYLDENIYRGSQPFSRNKLPVIGAFNALAESDIPERFPGLRFGFIEAAASWLPFMMTDLEKRIERRTGEARQIGKTFLRNRNFYVTCQVNDDLEHLGARIGFDNLIIGSDYGHADNASDLEAVRRLSQDPRLSPADRERVVSTNALSLYGLQ